MVEMWSRRRVAGAVVALAMLGLLGALAPASFGSSAGAADAAERPTVDRGGPSALAETSFHLTERWRWTTTTGLADERPSGGWWGWWRRGRSTTTTTTTSAPANPSTSTSTTRPTPPPSEDGSVGEVIRLVNQARSQAGCGPVGGDPALAAAAQRHATDMATNGFVDHTGSNGSTLDDRVSAQGYDWIRIGETVAAGYDTPDGVVDGWLGSGGRATLLDCTYTEIGVGRSGSSWTAVLGAPADVATLEREAVARINVARFWAGCRALATEPALTAAARAHATDMATNDFVDHTGSNGSTLEDRVSAQGYDWARVGETIAAGYDSPSAVVAGWLGTASGRANLLDCGFTEIGVGFRAGRWTANLATPS